MLPLCSRSIAQEYFSGTALTTIVLVKRLVGVPMSDRSPL